VRVDGRLDDDRLPPGHEGVDTITE
jgi:hypothetical protein